MLAAYGFVLVLPVLEVWAGLPPRSGIRQGVQFVMSKGYLALVLHTHLPYVRHPEHDDFLEEDWLFEAITETYIPLIHVFEGLLAERIPFRITMSMSPPLLAMLRDELLQRRYLRHLEQLIELARREMDRTAGQPEFALLAKMYYDSFTAARETFANRYGCDLTRAFRMLQDAGGLELITCGATHGFLPLMDGNRKAIGAQIRVARQYHEETFGRPPRGIWLPECGYAPGIDEFLAEEGIEFFILDTHGVLYASPRPKYGIYAPVFCESGVAAFGRDTESSKQVWSSKEGYPGDFRYRDFYRDIGFDLDYEYIGPFLHSIGVRTNTGIKYHRITGDTNYKEAYRPGEAIDLAAAHAGNFMFNREKQIEYLCTLIDRKPIIVAPYDAELFGHWWYEGPKWLDFLIRKIAFDQQTVSLASPLDYLEEYSVNQVTQPTMSSWGYKGYNEFWLDGTNDWIYRHLHKASSRMVKLASEHPQSLGTLRRALDQAARELLLAQSSDWAFIMKTGTVVEYAVDRTCKHIKRFTRLFEDIESNSVDEAWLSDIEGKDNIFPNIDYRVYAAD